MGAWSRASHDAPKELRLLLVGPRRSGKSSSGNTLLGRGRVFDTRGGGASTVASSVTAGRHVTVVDAQGWGSSDAPVPREEKIELLRALDLCAPHGPHVVLLVIPLLDFTEAERQAVERRMEVLTSLVWRHTMVLFTFGDRLRKRDGSGVEEHIRAGGVALSWLMERCRHRYHVLDNRVGRGRGGGGGGGGEQLQVRELLGKAEDLLLENGYWHYSFHMCLRMEEEWSRREQRLRAQLEAEPRGSGAGGKQREAAEIKINAEAKEEPRLETEEEEERGGSEESADRKVKDDMKVSVEEEGEEPEGTRIPGQRRPGQRSTLGPIRGLA